MEWEKENGILTFADGWLSVSFIPPEGLDFGATHLVFRDTWPDNKLIHIVGKKLVIRIREDRTEYQMGAGFTVPIADYPSNLKKAKKINLKDFYRIWEFWGSIVHSQYFWSKEFAKDEGWFLTMIRAQHLMSTLGQTLDWTVYDKLFNKHFYL